MNLHPESLLDEPLMAEPMTAWSIAQARQDAVRASWALRYQPAPPPAGWRTSARCRGLPPHLFFDDKPGPARVVSVAIAELCEPCPVRLWCLRAAAVEEQADADSVNGVRGGFSAAERRQLRRRRRLKAVTAA